VSPNDYCFCFGSYLLIHDILAAHNIYEHVYRQRMPSYRERIIPQGSATCRNEKHTRAQRCIMRATQAVRTVHRSLLHHETMLIVLGLLLCSLVGGLGFQITTPYRGIRCQRVGGALRTEAANGVHTVSIKVWMSVSAEYIYLFHAYLRYRACCAR
jgi:hypothetical protein